MNDRRCVRDMLLRMALQEPAYQESRTYQTLKPGPRDQSAMGRSSFLSSRSLTPLSQGFVGK